MQDVLVYVSINSEWLPTVTICLYSHGATANTQGEKGVFTLKTHQMFSVHTSLEKL